MSHFRDNDGGLEMFDCALVRVVVVLIYLVGNGSAFDMLARFQYFTETNGGFKLLG